MDKARLSHATATHTTNSTPTELATSELSLLLFRLQQTILHADPKREKRLRASGFERSRLSQNVQFARAQLTRLEHNALGIKAHVRRQEIQADLNRKRELLELIVDRLNDLSQIALDDDDTSSEGEDLLGDIIPTPSESMESPSTDIPAGDDDDADDAEEPKDPEEERTPDLPHTTQESITQHHTSQPSAEEQGTHSQDTTTLTTSQTLRSRRPQSQSQVPAPDSSYTTGRTALFADRRKGVPATPQTSTATAEAILDHQRAEQDILSESILKMAKALKTSSQRFSSTLDMDKTVLSKTGEGMDRTEVGMDAASRRMGTLRRMTEGQGWWGRMILFAWVYGMMIGLVLLVFVLPKLRF